MFDLQVGAERWGAGLGQQNPPAVSTHPLANGMLEDCIDGEIVFVSRIPPRMS